MLLRLVMSLLIEFGPIGAFFIAIELLHMPFIASTGVFVVTTTFALLVGFIIQRRIALFPLIVGLVVIGFGMATIHFHNPDFLILKETVYNGIFAVVLLGGLLFGKSYLEPLFSEIFSLTPKGWNILTLRWGIMFTLLAVSNEIVWHVTTGQAREVREMVWVHYKFWSVIATAVFALYQFRLSRTYRTDDASEWGVRLKNK